MCDEIVPRTTRRPTRRLIVAGLSTAALSFPLRAVGQEQSAAASQQGVIIPLEYGSRTIKNQQEFEAMASHNIVPGGLGGHELKFLITKVNTDAPQLYFMNSRTFDFHFQFAVTALNIRATNDAFNRATYFSSRRLFLAGSVMRFQTHKSGDAGKGIFTIEFWPTDPVNAHFADIAYGLIKNAFAFDDLKLAYHPSGGAQEDIWKRERTQFESKAIPVISTDELFDNISYSPLNNGVGIGYLRLVDGQYTKPLSLTDIAIFKNLPNDLTHVAGVISESPQTPLSHVNLRAQQNGTPNAYLKNAAKDPRVRALAGKISRLEVRPDGLDIRPASQAEMVAFQDAQRPKKNQILARNLSLNMIVPLRTIYHRDHISVGSKAANNAELVRILGKKTVPDGHAVPYYFYHRFMVANGLYTDIANTLSERNFKSDTAYRAKALKKIRKMIKSADMPKDLYGAFTDLQNSFPAGYIPRCRSSANSEDLIGFTGAGLYDSYTHRADEGHLSKSIKQVWASLWNFRAFEEREFYRIDHMSAAMGVLVQSNFDDEKVNGVAITKNVFFPRLKGFYINAQIGEKLVTNPLDGAIPEEILIVEDVNERNVLQFEKVIIRRSNLVGANNTVLSGKHLRQLIKHMGRIHSHFTSLYNPPDREKYALDIEFKVTKEDVLIIKQARPWHG